MIENYLQWAKDCRRYALEQARYYLYEQRRWYTEYLRAYDMGCRVTWDAAAQRFKWLQKDIEAMMELVRDINFPNRLSMIHDKFDF